MLSRRNLTVWRKIFIGDAHSSRAGVLLLIHRLKFNLWSRIIILGRSRRKDPPFRNLSSSIFGVRSDAATTNGYKPSDFRCLSFHYWNNCFNMVFRYSLI